MVNFNWRQKTSGTGTILNYRSCASSQYKLSVIQRTVKECSKKVHLIGSILIKLWKLFVPIG